ncbi:MAG: aldo/keto reductase [Clostridia bacterium]|nr:aldo/keto reductase [Clostridia bacterium]
MQYVTLGKTGLCVSRVGFGGIPIQRIEKDEAPALIEALVENGINYIDTARGYTVSEEWIGAAIEGRRGQFILATKSMARDRAGMAKDIETSLHNLRTDHIDLYQVHNPSMDQLDAVLAPGGALEALMEAKAAGKIRHIGITAHAIAVFKRALELDWVETIMFPYNIVESQCEELLPLCREKNIGFIAMKPLAGGAIEDGEAAMRYIAANELVTVAIPGMYSAEEVRANAKAGMNSAPLDEDELARVNKIRSELTGNFCRRCNYCAPCTVGISIPSVFLFAGYLERYGLADWAKGRYNAMKVKASACIGCGKCEPRCPYGLPIREMLKKAAKEFEG